LGEGKVRVADLVSDHVGLENLRDGIDRIAGQRAMKVVVNP
jgi:threonine dehydrogenase-like Zn-dependent dehydrogenase